MRKNPATEGGISKPILPSGENNAQYYKLLQIVFGDKSQLQSQRNGILKTLFSTVLSTERQLGASQLSAVLATTLVLVRERFPR